MYLYLYIYNSVHLSICLSNYLSFVRSFVLSLRSDTRREIQSPCRCRKLQNACARSRTHRFAVPRDRISLEIFLVILSFPSRQLVVVVVVVLLRSGVRHTRTHHSPAFGVLVHGRCAPTCITLRSIIPAASILIYHAPLTERYLPTCVSDTNF